MTTTPLHLLSFSDSLLALILSFCNAADLIQVLGCKNSVLNKATRLALSNSSSLHLSYIQQLDRCRNHGSTKASTSDGQEACVEILMNCIQVKKHHNNANTSKLQRIELSGLRHVAGNQGDWLSRIFGQFSTTLISIDFSGCAQLDPRKLHAAIVPPRSTYTSAAATATTDKKEGADILNTYCSIRELNFRGCYRVDSGIVLAVAKSPRFQQLEHLCLGGCSQSISDNCVLAIVQNLKQLRSLDLSGLKRITDGASEIFRYLPETLENLELAGCDLIRFSWLSTWGESLIRYMQQQQIGNHGSLDISRLPQNLWRELHRDDKKEPAVFHNWIKMNFSGIGTPRRGLIEGVLPYFAMRSMGSLREVYLSGCEQIHDWEMEILASVCANSLTCLEMRACCIGDAAIRAVGVHCNNIADLDFSACFEITDTGVISFCQYQGVRTRDRSSVRSLKLANLSRLTDQSIRAISSLEALLVLDVHDCQNVSTEAIAQAASNLKSLVDLEAKGIGQWSVAAAVSKSIQESEKSNQLRFINGRPCNNKLSGDNNDQKITGSCFESCMVRKQSKRLLSSQGVTLQPMFHCFDCKLTPSYNRGLCHACVSHCHSGHKTFVGSYTRFYCDCPFGITTDNNMQPVVCQLIADDET